MLKVPAFLAAMSLVVISVGANDGSRQCGAACYPGGEFMSTYGADVQCDACAPPSPPLLPLRHPPPSPPSVTPIKNANFKDAINECLRTNPVDGMCMSSEFGAMPDWDTSLVTKMRQAFRDKTTFNVDISGWDTSSVTDMYGMFNSARAFNQPIGAWDTSSVTVTSYMFQSTRAFNQPIGAWDTSRVWTMFAMFYDASAFNQPIGTWDTSRVRSMSNMFNVARAFAQDITGWSTPALTVSGSMFSDATEWLATFERSDGSVSLDGPPSSWRLQ